MFQIIFNKLSAAELSQLDTLTQLDLLDEFKVTADVLDGADERFGKISRDGAELYRFRCNDQRVYFEIQEDRVVVHRILNKNSFSDFLFRSSLPAISAEDEELSESKHFWSLIEEGKSAPKS